VSYNLTYRGSSKVIFLLVTRLGNDYNAAAGHSPVTALSHVMMASPEKPIW
jgi:hypothetical protein